MSNEKEILKRLIKIADNQQKVINKLAQNLDNLKPPSQDHKLPVRVIEAALKADPILSQVVIQVELKDKFEITFKAGTLTDELEARVANILKTLSSEGKISGNVAYRCVER